MLLRTFCLSVCVLVCLSLGMYVPSDTAQITVNRMIEQVPRTRDEVVSDYIGNFVQSTAQGKWTGTIIDCDPGGISNEVREQALRRLNYFRRQVRYTSLLSLGDELMQAAAQESALMLRANPTRPLHHEPPSDWHCWSEAGAFASRGNLFRGTMDRPGFAVWAVAFFMEDLGSNNTSVGHRSWFLQPNILNIGIGATGNSVTIWWMEENRLPEGSPGFVSWPPVGYVMDDLAYSRWSFHVVGLAQHVNARSASVRMFQKDSQSKQPLRVLHRRSNNWYLGGLVWQPKGLRKPNKGTDDITYEVEIDNLLIKGSPQSYQYEVTLIDAESVREEAGVDLSEIDVPLENRKMYK